MSGIVGIVRFAGLSERISPLWKGLSALEHRGSGIAQLIGVDGGSGIVAPLGAESAASRVTLPAVIAAIGACGNGVAATADGRFHAALDGRIYNAVDLLAESPEPVSLPGNPDVAALLTVLGDAGAEGLPRLVGMFAFAVLDIRRRRLLLGRDCFGMKPLYYSTADGFAFASQLGALLEFAGARPHVNAQDAYEFLRSGRGDGSQSTLLGAVHQLRPGHVLEIRLDRPEIPQPRRYWNPHIETRREPSVDGAAELLRQMLARSVGLHVRYGGSVGAALSGGLDSSSIVTTARALAADLPLHTFTFVAADSTTPPEWDEEPWSDLVGKAVRATMHKVRMSSRVLQEGFDRMAYVQDWPFGSPVIFAQHEVFRAAREAGVTSLMSGHGADNFFSISPVTWTASLMRSGRVQSMLRFALSTAREGGAGTREIVLGMASGIPLLRRIGKRLKASSAGWIDLAWFRERGVDFATFEEARGESPIRDALTQSMNEGLSRVLRFEDRNAASAGIQSCAPFLTPEIAEFALALPENLLIGVDGVSKPLLRSAMKGLVPEPVLLRRDRLGFPVPAQQWLLELGPWVSGLLDETTVPVLNRARVRRLWDDIRSGRDRSWTSTMQMWRCVSFIGWARRFNVQF